MKHPCQSLLLLCLVAIAARAQAPAEALRFSASYNSQSEVAEFAEGKAASLNFTRTLQYLDASLPGVVKAGFQTVDNERCHYAMAGNFDPRQGALSLWVRPENWRPADAAGYAFFVAEIPERYSLRLQKTPGEPAVALLVTVGGQTWKASAVAGHWLREEWHKLDVSWGPTALQFYVDGEAAGRIEPPAGGFPFPEASPAGYLSVHPNNWFGEPQSSPRHRTIVDEVRVYSRPLTAAGPDGGGAE